MLTSQNPEGGPILDTSQKAFRLKPKPYTGNWERKPTFNSWPDVAKKDGEVNYQGA